MNHEEIKDLIDQIDQSSIQEFSFQTQADALYISKIKERQTVTEKESNTGVDQVSTNVERVSSADEAKEVAGPQVATIAQDETVTNSTPVAKAKTIDSPLVGVVYLAKNPDQPPYKKVGDHVEAGETVCIVEAMKVMNEIPADISGTIMNVLVEDGQVVEFGQPLFEVSE
ncbi:acetyl-CoA carboxylase biotin carboxyl carrier protein [Aerococcus urinaeequi]|uniref:Biotin carboxyl carrier protein of acetyl-CoA carboxylase n=1 Tax=Aerococcus viridans TaxID=1377 RepID=A0A2N6UCJ2_9LACT|nr:MULTISPECIES: acetyl-CoA carboxylase biotin carboxyl carrier protein [Aerococcus]OFU51469.1 acetyl-CoA carboxylase, biotin carboxyl carrier protein [Aerococcus sp. HMSC10H05]PMC79304.1 acetyl-CoA carboxylase biotin carboxyl carrier protein [Aerococcus viridans]